LGNDLKTHAQAALSWLPDLLMLAGACSVSVGAGMIYAPAGYVVGGLLSLAAGVVLARGGK